MANPEILGKTVLKPEVLFPVALVIGTGMILTASYRAGYNAGEQEGGKNTFGVTIPDEAICDSIGTIQLPEQSNPNVIVKIYGKPFRLDESGLHGEFSVDRNGQYFFPVKADNKKGPDKVYFSFVEGAIKYRVECKKESTPTSKKPATTPLSSEHDRLIAYRGGFNGTKPAGRGGAIFRRGG